MDSVQQYSTTQFNLRAVTCAATCSAEDARAESIRLGLDKSERFGGPLLLLGAECWDTVSGGAVKCVACFVALDIAAHRRIEGVRPVLCLWMSYQSVYDYVLCFARLSEHYSASAATNIGQCCIASVHCGQY